MPQSMGSWRVWDMTDWLSVSQLNLFNLRDYSFFLWGLCLPTLCICVCVKISLKKYRIMTVDELLVLDGQNNILATQHYFPDFIHTGLKIEKLRNPLLWRNLHVYPQQCSVSSVQLLSHVQLFVTPWTAARQASLSITSSWSLLKLMPIESVMPSNHLILCRPLLLLPSIFPSIRVFSDESGLRIRWPKDWVHCRPTNEVFTKNHLHP